jgi:hypothetical protein
MPLVTEQRLSTLLHATVYVYKQFSECTGTDYKLNEISKKNLQPVTMAVIIVT